MKQIRLYRTLLSRLNDAEHFEVHEAILESTDNPVNDVMPLVPFYMQYKDDFLNQDDVFKLSRKLAETDELKMYHAQRRSRMAGLKQAIAAAWRISDPSILNAAKQLDDAIHPYKRATLIPYPQTTAMLSNLLQDLDESENKAAIERLNLTLLVDELEHANTAFKVLYRDRAARMEELKQMDTMQQARKKTDASFNNFAVRINGFYITAVTENTDPVRARALDKMIEGINASLDMAETDYYRHNDGHKPQAQESYVGYADGHILPTLPYRFIVDEQSLRTSTEMLVTDKNPDSLRKLLATHSPEGYSLFMNIDGEETDTKFVFSDFLLDERDNINGLILTTTRPASALLDTTTPGYFKKGNHILIEWDDLGIPMFDD